MENKSYETGEGYFSNRISKYMIEHHPDLLEVEDVQRQVQALSQQAIQLFLAYDQSGMGAYEAQERALVETLESIRSPYGSIMDYLQEHRELLRYLYPAVESDEPEVVETILRSQHTLVLALMDAPSIKEEKSARRSLLRAVMKTLSDRTRLIS